VSRFSDDFAESVVPNLLYHMGDSVTHYPQGIITNAVTVTGIWTPMSTVLDKSTGVKVCINGSLQLAASVTVDSRDIWLIDSVKYSAGKWMPLPGGMKQADLETVNQEFRTTKSSGGKW